jgi:hypothetical protein
MMHLLAVWTHVTKGQGRLGPTFAYVVALGVDVDTGDPQDPVSLADLDTRLQALEDSLVSSQVLSLQQTEGQFYADVLARCEPERSIVQSLVLAALHGERGTVTPPSLVPRLGPGGNTRVAVTDRMCTLFIYPMARIVKDNRYLAELDLSMGPDEVDDAILCWRETRQNGAVKQVQL